MEIKMKFLKWLVLSWLFGSCAVFAEPAREPLHVYRLLSLSVYDELAVVKGGGGEMVTLQRNK
jgi:hypothetical protein